MWISPSILWQWNVMRLWACLYGKGAISNDNIIIIIIINKLPNAPYIQKQGITKDLETGGQNWGFLKFRESKVSYPIYKNDHSNLIYWLSKTKCGSLCHLMYLLSCMSETFEVFPWTQTNTENLAKYNWVSFSQKSCVWESKWLPGDWL